MSQASELAALEAAVPKLMGPVVIANALNAMLYGLCFLQFLHYYSMGKRDSLPNQAMVCWTFAVDTTHTAASVWMLWYYLVQNFANAPVIGTLPWPYLSLPIFIILASLPIQQFFAWRIKQLSGSWIVFFALSILSLVSSGVGFANSAVAFTTPSVQDFNSQAHLVDIWLTLSMVCDGFLAGLLFYYLQKSRTGFKRTDSIITRIIHSCVESTALNSIFCMADLIVFNLYTESNYNLLVAMPMGRVYTITLLGMLNSRLAMREELEGELNDTSHAMQPSRIDRRFNISGNHRSTEVKVDVVDERSDVDAYLRSGSRESMKAPTVSDPSYVDHKQQSIIA
ncbi:hypothetical protein BKA93DRAFT_822805 [Sparassis latifolia]|uniref:DUF6534 domain-containing protein n=1 Tax=Sparassis crispa TaxID=139825 RepID=A0A401GGK5_9APHY|nr:hypothetical protein SCP_0310440 [Sparassis crispa]GBE81317.1 hypothetical protein SCP_0310440 [Sparassis crispa]